jgi:hypothetical protein
MELVLGEKTYIAPTPKARMVRKAIEMANKTNFSNLSVEEFDNLVSYVVDLYGKQFTIDELYDGLDADNLMPTIMECLNIVVGKVGAKLEEFPNE